MFKWTVNSQIPNQLQLGSELCVYFKSLQWKAKHAPINQTVLAFLWWCSKIHCRISFHFFDRDFKCLSRALVHDVWLPNLPDTFSDSVRLHQLENTRDFLSAVLPNEFCSRLQCAILLELFKWLWNGHLIDYDHSGSQTIDLFCSDSSRISHSY